MTYITIGKDSWNGLVNLITFTKNSDSEFGYTLNGTITTTRHTGLATVVGLASNEAEGEALNALEIMAEAMEQGKDWIEQLHAKGFVVSVSVNCCAIQVSNLLCSLGACSNDDC